MNQSKMTEVLPYFPGKIRYALEQLAVAQWLDVEEIRLRANAPLTISVWGESCFVTETGGISNHEKDALRVTQNEVQTTYLAVCENSVYAHMEEIRQGFITIRGGHRVGICGKAVVEDGMIKTFREISSLNIRIAHEVIGVADGIINKIVCGTEVKSTLIISPPQTGKTTLLRDITRQISNRGFKTGVADDRGELGAMFDGVAQNDLGAQTDLIDNAPKADAILLLLRTMSPKVIISDEIACEKDVNAIRLAHGTGVSIVATTHGRCLDEIKRRAVLKPIFQDNVFEQIILLQRDFSTMESIVNIRAVQL